MLVENTCNKTFVGFAVQPFKGLTSVYQNLISVVLAIISISSRHFVLPVVLFSRSWNVATLQQSLTGQETGRQATCLTLFLGGETESKHTSVTSHLTGKHYELTTV